LIVDSSPIVAVLLREVGYERFSRIISEEATATGAPTLAEAGVVLSTKRGWRRAMLLEFVAQTGLIVVNFTEEHASEAIAAHTRFGKGRHPARLNLGDCLTYAVAKLAREPLLTLDRGFAHTDLELV
jgi:ribonuclease VapC